MAGKTVLITGAAGTLGAAMAERFSEAGFRVLGCDRSHSNSERGVFAKWFNADLASSADAEKLAVGVLSFSGSPDAIIHCAGGFRWSKLDELSQSDWDFLMASNLTSSWQLLRVFLPKLKERGVGSLVFIGSKAALQPGAGMGAYSAAKAGLHALVAAAAEEAKGTEVRVNALLPSVLDTPPNRRDMPDADFTKWVSPGALADIAVSLCQPFGAPIRGALIPVSGGL
ncbi:MAG: SDR family NAD(P)-dependent oxidoreductase [Bdellovibrionales bacterium]|nr:SDR family NAD(P)-dependent oxidoreductase [Bdellovibrionales bacterium]